MILTLHYKKTPKKQKKAKQKEADSITLAGEKKRKPSPSERREGKAGRQREET